MIALGTLPQPFDHRFGHVLDRKTGHIGLKWFCNGSILAPTILRGQAVGRQAAGARIAPARQPAVVHGTLEDPLLDAMSADLADASRFDFERL
jgi:hypothetical protein